MLYNAQAILNPVFHSTISIKEKSQEVKIKGKPLMGIYYKTTQVNVLNSLDSTMSLHTSKLTF